MLQSRIEDEQHSGALALDLKHVLRALGREARGWTWFVSGVGREHVMATGDGGEALKSLERSGTSSSGAALLEIAERTNQVIWGDFQAFSDERRERREKPKARIIAFGSTWYDFLCEDEATMVKVASAFKNTRRIDPPTVS